MVLTASATSCRTLDAAFRMINVLLLVVVAVIVSSPAQFANGARTRLQQKPPPRQKPVRVTTSTTTTTLPPTTTEIEYHQFRADNVFGLQSSVDGSFCFLANFDARLVISSFEGLFGEGEKIYIPTNRVTVAGKCAESRYNEAILELTWDHLINDHETKLGTFWLQLMFEAIEWENPVKNVWEFWWKLEMAKLTYKPVSSGKPTDMSSTAAVSSDNEIVAVMSARQREKHDSHLKSPTGVNAPMGQALYCKHSLNVTFEGVSNESSVDVTLQLKGELQLQPYEATGNFGTSYLCERSRKINLLEQLRSSATIASGCVLAMATVGVIVGYVVKRQFFPKRTEYTSME